MRKRERRDKTAEPDHVSTRDDAASKTYVDVILHSLHCVLIEFGENQPKPPRDPHRPHAKAKGQARWPVELCRPIARGPRGCRQVTMFTTMVALARPPNR